MQQHQPNVWLRNTYANGSHNLSPHPSPCFVRPSAQRVLKCALNQFLLFMLFTLLIQFSFISAFFPIFFPLFDYRWVVFGLWPAVQLDKYFLWINCVARCLSAFAHSICLLNVRFVISCFCCCLLCSVFHCYNFCAVSIFIMRCITILSFIIFKYHKCKAMWIRNAWRRKAWRGFSLFLFLFHCLYSTNACMPIYYWNNNFLMFSL